MSGHHLVISDEGGPYLRCDEPTIAACHMVFDCSCEEPFDVGATDNGAPYHVPVSEGGDLHAGRFEPTYCNIEEWFSAYDPEDLLSGEYAIPLRVEWGNDGPILHLPEPTKEDR